MSRWLIMGAVIVAASWPAAGADDSVRLMVPYVKQPKALCGGAAATMVLRYWSDRQTDVREFAPFVDRRAGGISNETLARAIGDRGWNAVQFSGSIDAIKERLRAGQPIVVLTHERGERFHYVVAVGFTSEAIVLHDPARGPFRRIRIDRFARAWRDAGSWALLVLPNAEAR